MNKPLEWFQNLRDSGVHTVYCHVLAYMGAIESADILRVSYYPFDSSRTQINTEESMHMLACFTAEKEVLKQKFVDCAVHCRVYINCQTGKAIVRLQTFGGEEE